MEFGKGRNKVANCKCYPVVSSKKLISWKTCGSWGIARFSIEIWYLSYVETAMSTHGVVKR